MIKFDKNKPHGVISGVFEEKPTARYTQNGRFFDAQGALLLSDEEIAEEAAALEAQLAALKAAKGNGVVAPTEPVPTPAPAVIDVPAPVEEAPLPAPAPVEEAPLPAPAPVEEAPLPAKEVEAAKPTGRKAAKPSALPDLPK